MFTRRRFLRFVAGIGVAGGLDCCLWLWRRAAVSARVARYHVTPPHWPSDLQLKIAAIADLHACDPWMSLSHIAAIVERTNALKPDVIVLLGDYVTGHRHVTRHIPAEEWGAGAGRIKGPARRPMRSSAINDYWDDKTVQREGRGPTIARRGLERAGIPVYENDAVRLLKDDVRSGWPGLGDQLAYFPRGISGRSRASASTISMRRWQR